MILSLSYVSQQHLMRKKILVLKTLHKLISPSCSCRNTHYTGLRKVFKETH